MVFTFLTLFQSQPSLLDVIAYILLFVYIWESTFLFSLININGEDDVSLRQEEEISKLAEGKQRV